MVTEQRVEPGDHVRIGGGVFAGVEGKVVERINGSRAIVALDLEQPGVSLEIDEQQLELLTDA